MCSLHISPQFPLFSLGFGRTATRPRPAAVAAVISSGFFNLRSGTLVKCCGLDVSKPSSSSGQSYEYHEMNLRPYPAGYSPLRSGTESKPLPSVLPAIAALPATAAAAVADSASCDREWWPAPESPAVPLAVAASGDFRHVKQLPMVRDCLSGLSLSPCPPTGRRSTVLATLNSEHSEHNEVNDLFGIKPFVPLV